ncbi:MAG: hypothetical protein JO057_17705 [Chloroflexi bacterium]|nr:hypothetical protein [Chloroflexota bacterium]
MAGRHSLAQADADAIIHWPKGMRARGELRHQFHHVIDVPTTILEVAGLPQPTLVNGVDGAAHGRSPQGNDGLVPTTLKAL